MSKTERVLVTRETASSFYHRFPWRGRLNCESNRSHSATVDTHMQGCQGPPIGTPANASPLIFHLFVLPETLKEIMAGESLSSLPFVWKTIAFGPEDISKRKRSNGSEHGAARTSAAAFGNSAFINPVGGWWLWDIGLFFKNLLIALWVGFHMDFIKPKKEMIQKSGLQIASPSLFLVWIGTPTVYDLDLGSLQIPIRFLDHHTLLRRYRQLPCLQAAPVCSSFSA